MKFAIRLVAFGLLAVSGGAIAQDYDGSATGYGTDDNTDAGTTVSNTATVTYEVNGVAQDAEVNDPAAQFVVDRVILVNVSNMDPSNQVSVTPGATGAYVRFDVVNDSNDTLDLILDAHVVTTDFTPTNVQFWLENGATPGGLQTGEDTLLTVTGDGILLAGMTEEEVARIYVSYDIPSAATAADAETAAVTLVAIAYENDGLGATAVVETNVATTNEVDRMIEDTVFGDLDGPFNDGVTQDVDEDGMHSATGTFVVGSATITVTKTSVVIADPFNGTTNPKAIPGAEVLYCIEVTNTGGSPAENVSVKDPIPTGTTYVNESIKVFTADVTCGAALVSAGGTVITDDDADDATEDTNNGGISGNSGDGAVPEADDSVVNTTVGSLAATTGATATIFRVTID